MLSIDEIEKYYNLGNLKERKRNLLQEYLQYKILQIIFSSDYASRLIFIGGTALRIVYSNTRFSEDLDFDNFDLSFEDFEKLGNVIKNSLELEGSKVEIRTIEKGAFHCYIKIPEILITNKITTNKFEKIDIHIDTVREDFKYIADTKLINKFDVFTNIKVASLDILLSKKINAIFGRKAAKGRDFYDFTFVHSQVLPNYEYLRFKLNIHNVKELKTQLLEKIDTLNFKELVKDVNPFLFNPNDINRVLLFKDYIDNNLLQ